MDTLIITTVTILCFLVCGFCFMMLARNEWVYRKRVEMINYIYDRPGEEWLMLGRPSMEEFLPPYREMMRKFWVWDINKFLLRPKDL